MKNISIALLCLTFFYSCRGSYDVYISITRIGEDEIVGYKLDEFFKGRRNIKKIKILNKELFYREMFLVKDTLKKSVLLPKGHLSSGFYQYAFIILNDTLYADSSLICWRYKDKTCIYNGLSDEFKKELSTQKGSIPATLSVPNKQ